MADWTNVADATLEPGKPIRAIDARALRENPIAIAEGAPGAPKIDGAQGPAVETGGITDLSVTAPKLATGSVTALKLATGIDERAWVGERIQETAVDEIGSIIVAWNVSGGGISSRNTIAGSNLRYATSSGEASMFERVAQIGPLSGGSLSGTWRNIGGFCSAPTPVPDSLATRYFPSIWVRVS